MRRMIAIVLAAAFAAVCLASTASSASPTLDLNEYRSLLEAEQAGVEKICAGWAAGDDGETDEAIRQMRRNYRNYRSITVNGGGRPQKVDLSWFDRGMAGALKSKGPKQLEALTEVASLLGSARQAASGLLTLPEADTAARPALARILSRPEFSYLDKKDRGESWIERLRRKMGDFLAHLLGGTGKAFRFVFSVPVAIAVVALSVAYLFWRLGSRIPRPVGAEEVPERETLLALGPDKLASQATGTARSGDCRQAMRLLYLALLAQLDRAGFLQYVPYRTNWEYLNQLRESDAKVAGLFAEFTFLFERKWYGMELCGIADYEKALRAYRLLLSEGGI